jgi:hypothetical protein
MPIVNSIAERFSGYKGAILLTFSVILGELALIRHGFQSLLYLAYNALGYGPSELKSAKPEPT